RSGNRGTFRTRDRRDAASRTEAPVRSPARTRACRCRAPRGSAARARACRAARRDARAIPAAMAAAEATAARQRPRRRRHARSSLPRGARVGGSVEPRTPLGRRRRAVDPGEALRIAPRALGVGIAHAFEEPPRLALEPVELPAFRLRAVEPLARHG